MKKLKLCEEEDQDLAIFRKYSDYTDNRVVDFDNSLSVERWMEGFSKNARFGSVTKEIEDLRTRQRECMNLYLARFPNLAHISVDRSLQRDASMANQPVNTMANQAAAGIVENQPVNIMANQAAAAAGIVENQPVNIMANQTAADIMANQPVNIMANRPINNMANQAANLRRDMVVSNSYARRDLSAEKRAAIFDSDDEEFGKPWP